MEVDGAPRVRMRSSAAIKTSLSGNFAPNDKIDWLRDELRPVLIIDGVEFPLGIYAPATVTPSTDGEISRISVEAYDRCWRVQSTRTEELLFIASGTNYIDAIKSLLSDAGIALVLSTPTDATLRFDREDWTIGESYLTIINQLLDEINYSALWFNSSGYAVLEPKRDFDASSIQRTYDPSVGPSRTFTKVSNSLDLYNAPNVFICVCSNPDGTAPMVSVAENNVPVSPLSILRRGRRIAQTYKVQNIASQAALDEYAQNLCKESMILGTTVQISTALMPGLGPDAVVAMTWPGMEGICRESEWQMELKPGGTMTHKLQRTVMQL